MFNLKKPQYEDPLVHHSFGFILIAKSSLHGKTEVIHVHLDVQIISIAFTEIRPFDYKFLRSNRLGHHIYHSVHSPTLHV